MSPEGTFYLKKSDEREIRPFGFHTFAIGLVGFEPTASWSRTRRSTKLSHSPKNFRKSENRSRLRIISRIYIVKASATRAGEEGQGRQGLGLQIQAFVKKMIANS